MDWHNRFVQQAAWTEGLRRYLYPRVGLKDAHRALEVGCGTGALLAELTMQMRGTPFGLDLSPEHLSLAAHSLPGLPLVCADAHALPFASASFEVTFCHFLLLWVEDAVKVVRQMARLTRPGGSVLALAEPDYGGRVDHPPELAELGQWQMEALRRQGADPQMGRRLAGIFHQAGLASVETGVLGGQWAGAPSAEEWELEWGVIEADLGKQAGLEALRTLDRAAWESGERVLFVPTFYAWGRVPENS